MITRDEKRGEGKKNRMTRVCQAKLVLPDCLCMSIGPVQRISTSLIVVVVVVAVAIISFTSLSPPPPPSYQIVHIQKPNQSQRGKETKGHSPPILGVIRR